jgi:hypothetical protein
VAPVFILFPEASGQARAAPCLLKRREEGRIVAAAVVKE